MATLKALVAMPDHMAESGEWRKSITTAGGQSIPPRTFQNHRRDLLDEGFIENVEGREQWYRATDSGVAMASEVPSQSQRQSPIADAANATPPIGVAEGTGEAPERNVRIKIRENSEPSGGTLKDPIVEIFDDGIVQ
jgi:hypothetical protein